VLCATEQNCQSVGAHRLEQLILREVFAVLEPAALAATAQALAEAEAHHRARLAAFELAVERARYEADRARRHFDNVSRRTGSLHAPWNLRWKTSSARLGGQRTIWSPRARRPARWRPLVSP
jgi:hypothetical protein